MNSIFTKNDFINTYNGKKVLIIGNTGFKGSWLSLWLYMLGAEVYGYALEPVGENSHFALLGLDKKTSCTFADIRDSVSLNEIFKKIQPEFVFHLAAQAIVRTSYQDPKGTFDTNIGGSVNVLEAVKATESVKSFIYVTSDKCYKNKEWIWGYREIDDLGGVDPYSTSKACAELVFSSYKQCFFDDKRKIGISSVRAGNVIGGGDWADNRIVPDCIRALAAGQAIEIRNPQSTRPWQHVLEPLSGYLTLGAIQYENPAISSSWNFGPRSNAEHTVEKLVNFIIKQWGSGSLSVIPGDTFYESNLLKLNCDKAYQHLGWEAKWDFEETVSKTADWYISFVRDGKVISEEQIEVYMNRG